MRASEADIQRLAARIIEALVRTEQIRPKRDKAALAQRVASILLDNLKAAAALEEEAERMAESHARQMGGLDQRRVVQMILQKLAEERGFPL